MALTGRPALTAAAAFAALAAVASRADADGLLAGRIGRPTRRCGQVEVNQPFWRPAVRGGFPVGADSTIGARRTKNRGAAVRHKKRPPAHVEQGPLAMTALNGGPLRRTQVQDRYRFCVSKEHLPPG
jgi:hypothetical protein